MANLTVLKRNIHLSHAKQLAQLQLPTEHDIRREEPSSELLQTITKWITDNPGAIKAAQDSRCTSTGPDTPNWDAVFISLVESTAMYLRQYPEVVKAAKAARDGNLEQAADHLKKAQEEIDTVAALLNCTFLQLCDFVTQSPDGSPSLSGAFCGVFISNSTERPYMGIAYKGTSTNPEGITDLVWAPIMPYRPGVAWGALMHAGFYQGLFGTFTTEVYGPQVPFDLMLETLSSAYASRPSAQLHFTGHSLGGAYCIITYGEFLRRQAELALANFKFGDMHAFGAPRVCLEPFATEFNRHTQIPGGGKYSFRIVNELDPVTTIPPAFKDQVLEFPFVHPASAWKITTGGPEKMNDEPPPVDPQSVTDLLANAHFHDPKEYYASWQKTPHS
ncbi:alpha/beta-hydrolase [Lentinus tigrinus ALCF2SS1-7]|uniref:Alpha/beta-hydrolase n=1 Tax=Lentinus tigrinus ALCF2SS1-6 TaxID=1328759 RepID=A0A5C2RZI4_9APHY|nr:alpha/beta-hydrolase [Lentinus tigrinus ALCF2SS1-6]RPD79619.1 alpha/beta-hydrolase [Lentinus tigrinus ALCF2SS1-7]